MVQIEEVDENEEPSKAPAPDTPTAFQVILAAVVKSAQSDPETANQLKISLQTMYDTPPIKSVSAALDREITADHMRRMLFNPTEADMGTYARLIPGANKLNPEGPEQPAEGKASTPFLSLLYLYHSHDPETAKTFVLAGGLMALAKVVHAPNVYVRGQCLEILTQLTGTIDWFAEPDKAGWDELSTLSLNRMMLGLIQTQFLPDLLANVSEPAGPQQGNIPFCALRIAAFWLSWVRYTFARQLGPQGMCVSGSILEKLQGFVGKEGGSTEDLELAQKVADDFGGVTATEHEGPWGSGLTIHQDCSKIAREAGNEVFKQGRCMCAAANYSIAIDLNPQDPANYTNRAAAMLKFSANCSGQEKVGMLQRVIKDASTALQLPENSG